MQSYCGSTWRRWGGTWQVLQHLAVDYMQVFCKGSDICTSRTSKIISRLLIVKMKKTFSLKIGQWTCQRTEFNCNHQICRQLKILEFSWELLVDGGHRQYWKGKKLHGNSCKAKLGLKSPSHAWWQISMPVFSSFAAYLTSLAMAGTVFWSTLLVPIVHQ